MKKIIYSGYTKFTAVVLCIFCVLLSAGHTMNMLDDLKSEKFIVYQFESDFENSVYLSKMLSESERIVYEAYLRLINVNDFDSANVIIRPDKEAVEKILEKRFGNLYCIDNINVFVKWDDAVYTNCGALSADDVMRDELYSIIQRSSNGDFRRDSTTEQFYGYSLDGIDYNYDAEITVVTSIKESAFEAYERVWERQESIFDDLLDFVSVCMIVALLLLIFLIAVCGKDKDGKYKTIWIDKVWIEAQIAFVGCVGIGSAFISVIMIKEYYSGRFPYSILNMLVCLLAVITSAAIITMLLSVARNIKCKRFAKSSVIACITRWSFKTVLRVLRWLYGRFTEYKSIVVKALSKKTGVVLIGMLFVYTALLGICGILGYMQPGFIILGVLLFGFASFFVLIRARELDEVKRGADEVCNGNISYKIPELKSEDMKALANDINDIANGLEKSVSAKLRAEKLKTELITNVSHDLKTPITSIISYAELLSKIEGLPEEARDYVSVIAKKSERLKNLTQDLFDISKVQSGNEEVISERLDVSLLINQILGEYDREIKESELMLCVNMQGDLYVLADSRKLFRVMSNLVSNILKYTMKNTRAFITAFERDGEVIIELKNIAAYPINFTADEIVGRFVRGDESRTQEGNGLGLAIAKSYTEICNGKFEIVLDGDMFKTVICFEKYE